MACATVYTVTNAIFTPSTGVPPSHGASSSFDNDIDAVHAKWGEGADVSYYSIHPEDSTQPVESLKSTEYAIIRWPDGTFITTPPKDCQEASLQEALATYESGGFSNVLRGLAGVQALDKEDERTALALNEKKAVAIIEELGLEDPFTNVGEWIEAVSLNTGLTFENKKAVFDNAVDNIYRERNAMVSAMMLMDQSNTTPFDPPYTLAKRELYYCIKGYQKAAAMRGEIVENLNRWKIRHQPDPWRVDGESLVKGNSDEVKKISGVQAVQEELALIRDATNFIKGKQSTTQPETITSDSPEKLCEQLNKAQDKYHTLSSGVYQELAHALDVIRPMPELNEIAEKFPEETDRVKETLATLLYDPAGPSLAKLPAAINAVTQWEQAIRPHYEEAFTKSLLNNDMTDMSPAEAIQVLFAS